MDFANAFMIKSFWAGKPYKSGVSAINRMGPISLGVITKDIIGVEISCNRTNIDWLNQIN